MGKRKADETLDFFKVAGVTGISDNLIRTVVKRLKNDDTTDKIQGGRSIKRRFPELQHFITEHDCGLTTVNLQLYLDKVVAINPDFLKLWDSTVLATQKSHGSVQAFIYVDEVVPGNIIAPDNKRRSFCYYICWKDLVNFRSDLLWFPFAMIRHDNVEKCEGDLVGVFTLVLKDLQPFLCSLIVGSNLIQTTRLFFIADEDGLKKSASHKGASGLRPCIKCKNCISKGNSVPGYFDISESNWSSFELATDIETKEMFAHLKHVCANASKKDFEEASKLSGWKWLPQLWAEDDELWSLLKVSDFCYDNLHNYFSCGTVPMEIGLFLEATLNKTELTVKDIENALKQCEWKKASSIGGQLSDSAVPALLYHKLWKKGCGDYKGDAGQSLSLLSLLAHFATTVLEHTADLQEEIQSLVALTQAVNCIMQGKQKTEDLFDLVHLQQEHLSLFCRAYSKDIVRPKHHYSFHTTEQVATMGIQADCWPCERKNKAFKLSLAPQIMRLDKFERSILLRWLECDLDKLKMMPLPKVALINPPTAQPFSNATIASGLRHEVGEFRSGNVLLFNAEQAYFMIGAACHGTSGFCLLLQTLESLKAGPRLIWSTWKITEKYVNMPVESALQHIRTSWYSIDEPNRTLLLLR